jgi:hypothetical protein
MSARIAREASGEARARGYFCHDSEDFEDEDMDDLEGPNPLLDRSSAWWTDQVSGCPSGLEETVMVLLDAGFTPQDCPILREKLCKVMESAIKTYVKRFRMGVAMSCVAFLVPGTSDNLVYPSCILLI